MRTPGEDYKMIDGQEPTDDDRFELLVNPRRRLLLQFLLENGGAADLRELSRELVAHESGTPLEEIDSGDASRMYATLYQNHIPMLEARGYVEYDDSEGHLYFGDRADEIVRILDDSTDRQRRWGIYYTGIAIVLVTVLLARQSTLLTVPKPIVSLATAGAAVTLLGTAVVHYYRVQTAGSGSRFLRNLVS